MKRMILTIAVLFLSLVAATHSQAQCGLVTAGGVINDPVVSRFGGTAMTTTLSTVDGLWHHDDAEKRSARGQIEYLFCRHVDEGPGGPNQNQAYFGGPALWFDSLIREWQDGYWLDVVIKDLGTPGPILSDTYHFTIREFNGVTAGVIVHETSGTLVKGDVRIFPASSGHPHVPSPLPAWVTLEP